LTAQLTFAVYDYGITGHQGAADAGDKGLDLRACADADSVRLACNTRIAYFDIIAACGESRARLVAEDDVIAPTRIVKHGISADDRIAPAGSVAQKDVDSDRRVQSTGGVCSSI
jgi:hypothetical protein